MAKQQQINVRSLKDRCETLKSRIEVKANERGSVYRSRSRKWQSSKLGEEYFDRTSMLHEAIESIEEAIESLEDYID